MNLKTQSKVGILLKERGVEKGAGGLFVLEEATVSVDKRKGSTKEEEKLSLGGLFSVLSRGSKEGTRAFLLFV